MLFDFSLAVPGRHVLYSWTVFIGFLFWAGLPPHCLIYCSVCALSSRETPILAGGIGVARAVAGAVLLFVFGLEQL